MFKWLKESLGAGNATVKYPFEPMKLTPDMRGKPEHDACACIACGACATACPPNAIQMELELKDGFTVWKINYGRCIFCGRCEEACPVRAITLSQEFELAVMAKADLEETARYRLQSCCCCGRAFAPRKEIAYLKQLLATNATTSISDGAATATASASIELSQAEESLDICPTCKRERESETIKRFFTQRKARL
jgi:hydrogenase-4 component H